MDCGSAAAYLQEFHTSVENVGDRLWLLFVRGSLIWNGLPRDLQSSDILLTAFRNRPKPFLFDAVHNSAFAACENLGCISDSITIIII